MTDSASIKMMINSSIIDAMRVAPAGATVQQYADHLTDAIMHSLEREPMKLRVVSDPSGKPWNTFEAMEEFDRAQRDQRDHESLAHLWDTVRDNEISEIEVRISRRGQKTTVLNGWGHAGSSFPLEGTVIRWDGDGFEKTRLTKLGPVDERQDG